jgi:hypothetical protein
MILRCCRTVRRLVAGLNNTRLNCALNRGARHCGRRRSPPRSQRHARRCQRSRRSARPRPRLLLRPETARALRPRTADANSPGSHNPAANNTVQKQLPGRLQMSASRRKPGSELVSSGVPLLARRSTMIRVPAWRHNDSMLRLFTGDPKGAVTLSVPRSIGHAVSEGSTGAMSPFGSSNLTSPESLLDNRFNCEMI